MVASLVDIVLRNLPRIFIIAVYLYITSILLLISIHGTQFIIAKGLFYDPKKLAMLTYKTLRWWWMNKTQLGIVPILKISSIYLISYYAFSKTPYVFNKALDNVFKHILSPLKIFNIFNKKKNIQDSPPGNNNPIVQSSFNKNGKKYSPQEISAMKERIMKKVEKQLDNKLGDIHDK